MSNYLTKYGADACCTDGSQVFSSPYPAGEEPAGYYSPQPCGGGSAGVTVSCACPVPLATTARAGAVVVGQGLTVQVHGYNPQPGKVDGQIDLDFLGLGLNTDQYDPRDTTHPVHAAAAYNLGQQAALGLLLSRLSSSMPSPGGTSGGSGPQPTGGGSDDGIPTVGAVIDYVDEAVASAAADGLAAAREVYTFAGDGAKKSFPIQHTLMEKEVLASVLDSSGSAVIVRVVFQAVNNLLVMFADPPAAGEQFTIVLCK